jgi:putative ABC transport system permease protein
MHYWLRRLFRKQETERQLDSELRFHMEQRIAERVGSGETPEEARRQAQIEFGATEAIKQECRESRRVHFLEVLLQDLRYGLRMLRRNPGFTIVAVITLALGIGANTAIFSVVNGVLLNPLPYPHPEQLITVHESKANFQYGSVSYPNFRDWQKNNRVFSALAARRSYAFSLTGMGDAEQLNGLFVTADLFPLLGINPILGRNVSATEDDFGAPPVVLISRSFWQRKFGSATDILGKSITLDARNYTIIGVMPNRLDLGPTSRGYDVFVPLAQWSNPLLKQRFAGLGIHLIGRLRDGITFKQAQDDMDGVAENLAAAYPDVNKGIGASLIPLRQQVVGRVRPFLLVLMISVGFVLLIACVNVANLLLARSIARKREFAVRLSLGAPARRIIRQLLTESILLSGAGGSMGVALAAWTTPVMLKMLPDALPRVEEISLDVRVLLFALVISLLCGILFGLFPALRLSHATALSAVKEGDSRSGRTGFRAQNSFVAAETALAVVLLIGAGLMIRTLAQLWKVDPGFNPKNVLTFGITLAPSMAKASTPKIRAAYRELESALLRTPGVQSVAVSWGAVPLQDDDEILFWMEGRPKPSSPNDMNWALNYVVGPDYLKVMQIPLLRGRFLTSHDDENSPPVVVIDEALAQKFFPGQDPVGKIIHLDDDDKTAEIVGVVKHVKQWGLQGDEKQSLQAQMYRPFMQLADKSMALSPSGTGVLVRFNGKPAGVFDSLRSIVRQMSRDQVIFGAQTMEETISSSLAPQRYSMMLLTGFAGLALLLAAIGIYGVMSYVVGQRTQEIGIRMALGAQRTHVLRLILSRGVKMALLGASIGLMAALALSRLIRQLLYGISPADPLTFVAVALLLLFIALLACYLPARRAASVNPTLALRCE